MGLKTLITAMALFSMGLAQAEVLHEAGNPETRLIGALQQLTKQEKIEPAISDLQQLVEAKPKFRLAQLVYADMLMARAGGLAVRDLFRLGPDRLLGRDVVRQSREVRLRCAAVRPRRLAPDHGLKRGTGSRGAGRSALAGRGRRACGPDLRETFDQFVGETFYGQMVKAMRKTVGKPAYFHGGRGEDVFQQQLDQLLVERITKSTSSQFTGPMFELFELGRQK